MSTDTGPTVWLPYPPQHTPGLPQDLTYGFWDGTGPLPGDPGRVRFMVPPPRPGAEEEVLGVTARMPRLEVLQLLSSGHDYLRPFLGGLPRGVRVATARGVHAEATAELAVTLLLTLARGIDRFLDEQSRARWYPEVRSTLLDKRVVVLGYGAVGSGVARRLRAFGSEVVPVARTARTEDGVQVRALTELPELLPGADAVVLCAPLTDETRGLFDAKRLALLKDGAFLVNVARGEVVVTEDLVDALRGGRIRAALDVTDPEPLPLGHPLWGMPNVLITPHVAAFTDAFTTRSVDFLREQLHRFARGEEPANVVLVTDGGSVGRAA